MTERAFLPRWTDYLPGKAPTRAVYRVRGITAAGVASDWLVIALVRVPDVRIPPPPNFLVARPPANGENRAIECTWTHAGPRAGIGFVIEARDHSAGLDPEDGWQDLIELLPLAVALGPDGRFRLNVGGQRPGCLQDLRICAIRHALDPDDPRAITLRRIRSVPSKTQQASATGNILGPTNLILVISADGVATLRWSNTDSYRNLEVQRREPGRWGFERKPIAADATQWTEKLTAHGKWAFRLIAVGWGEQVTSNLVVTEWIAP
jgi:hypothetical protein